MIMLCWSLHWLMMWIGIIILLSSLAPWECWEKRQMVHWLRGRQGLLTVANSCSHQKVEHRTLLTSKTCTFCSCLNSAPRTCNNSTMWANDGCAALNLCVRLKRQLKTHNSLKCYLLFCHQRFERFAKSLTDIYFPPSLLVCHLRSFYQAHYLAH